MVKQTVVRPYQQSKEMNYLSCNNLDKPQLNPRRVKKSNLKRLQTAWFHLHNICKITSLSISRADSGCQGLREEETEAGGCDWLQNKAWGILERELFCYLDCGDALVNLHMINCTELKTYTQTSAYNKSSGIWKCLDCDIILYLCKMLPCGKLTTTCKSTSTIISKICLQVHDLKFLFSSQMTFPRHKHRIHWCSL